MIKLKKTVKRKKAFGLASVDKIDSQIINLSHATKSDWAVMSKIHLDLCRRSPLYYAWHKHPNAESVHWLILTLIILYALYINSQLIIYYSLG